MTLYETLRSDIKAHLKEGNRIVSTTLRGIDSAVQLRAKEDKVEITDDVVLTVLTKAIKQRQDSIEAYTKADRQDLVDDETFEMKILKAYMPAQLTDDEVSAIVNDAIIATGATSMRDMGKVMGIVMKKTKGKADGKAISALVKERLS